MDKVEDILKQYPYFAEDIKIAQAKLNKYISLQQEARNPLKGQALTGMPHTYDVSDQTLNAVTKIIDRYQVEIDRYTAEINEILDRKRWLDKAFTELTDMERRTLYMKYDKGMRINKIAYVLNYSRPVIYKIIDDAKAKIRRII